MNKYRALHPDVSLGVNYSDSKEQILVNLIWAETEDFPWGLQLYQTFIGTKEDQQARTEQARELAIKVQKYLDILKKDVLDEYKRKQKKKLCQPPAKAKRSRKKTP